MNANGMKLAKEILLSTLKSYLMAIKKRNLVIMNLVGFVIGLLLVGVTFIIDQPPFENVILAFRLRLSAGTL